MLFDEGIHTYIMYTYFKRLLSTFSLHFDKAIHGDSASKYISTFGTKRYFKPNTETKNI